MKRFTVIFALLALAAFPVLAGEWHTGQSNLCADCHTMHNSMAHTWSNAGVVSSTGPVPDGNWVRPGTVGGSNFLLKADNPNALCLACHDGKTFAPDVLMANSGGGAPNRSAGYLNELGVGANHTGHTLDQVGTAPGGTFTTGTEGLECIHCHTQHGRPGVYRNLGPRNATVPTYALANQQPADMTGQPTDLAAAAASATLDVFITLPGTYTANTSNFGSLYDTANIKYLKRALTDGIENASGRQCAACHGAFHGGVASANIGGEQVLDTAGVAVTGAFDRFNRHPVGGVVIGKVGGGHSDPIASRYNAVGVTAQVKTYSDLADMSDATPGCISCHKAHGNGQPFGLIFAARTGTMTEEGTFAANPTPTGPQTAVFQRALCGQCHKQGT